ncbi:MAG: hypothetical protein SVK44_08550 [Nitrospirota bacterium]|nr:hypothetical protein [Nitrospirota bacterium]
MGKMPSLADAGIPTGSTPAVPAPYRRVLASPQAHGIVLTDWLYVVGNRWTGGCKQLTGGIWH